ncbi:MAG: hypothetical protein ABL903_01305 [Methylococcales bacterium]
MKPTVLFTVLLGILVCLAITSCGQGEQASKVSQPATKKYAQATILEGVVSNNKGVIKTGTVAATDENGRVITQATMDNGHYRLEIPADTVLPILLTFSSESGAEKLSAAVIYDTITTYYINPSSTAIAKAAKEMGGYNRANMVHAAENTVHIPDGNKTSTGWRGDPTTQYGGWH